MKKNKKKGKKRLKQHPPPLAKVNTKFSFILFFSILLRSCHEFAAFLLLLFFSPILRRTINFLHSFSILFRFTMNVPRVLRLRNLQLLLLLRLAGESKGSSLLWLPEQLLYRTSILLPSVSASELFYYEGLCVCVGEEFCLPKLHYLLFFVCSDT